MIVAEHRTEVEPPIEHRFLAAGWRDPAELARVCDALDLRYLDFADRLCGVALAYVRSCADRGVAPDLDECEHMLSERGVPRSPGELYHILQEPPTGESITDLAQQVQQTADSHTDQLCTMLTRDAFRAVMHTFGCPNCIGCSQGKRRPQAWRLPRYDRATT